MAVDRTNIESARASLRTAVDNRAVGLSSVESARVALEATLREHDPNSSEAQQWRLVYADRVASWKAAVTAEANARQALSSELAKWLSNDTGTALSIDEELARVGSGYGIVLLPVRLETRFDLTAKVLKIRIYPDEIFADSHEPLLTEEEYQARLKFQAATTQDEEKRIWAELVTRFTSQRAAYITGDVPRPELRPASVPSRPIQAVLPDRWVAAGFRDGELKFSACGAAIPEPLDLTADPGAAEPTMVKVGDTFSVPKNIAWTMDFQKACQQGMGIQQQLTDEDLQKGFDRIIVFGVKSSMAPGTGGELAGEDFMGRHLERLFASHRFRRGVALVPQGTPTNNMPGLPTAFPPADPNGAASYLAEKIGPVEPALGCDYEYLAEALGMRTSALKHIGGAAGPDALWDWSWGKAMNDALWPATLGYFMKAFLNPAWTGAGVRFGDADIGYARRLFTGFVRACGTLPAVRIGAVPYGVVPMVSLQHHAHNHDSDSEGDWDTPVVNSLRYLLELWKSRARSLPTLSRDAQNAQEAFLKIISQPASSNEVLVRHLTGPLLELNGRSLMHVSTVTYLLERLKASNVKAEEIGQPEWSNSRILYSTLNPLSLPFDGPLVTAKPSKSPLEMNYIADLAELTLTVDSLQSEKIDGRDIGERPRPLLYLLLRHALLCECLRIGSKMDPTVFTTLLGTTNTDQEMWKLGSSRSDIFDVLRHKPTDNSEPTLFDKIKKSGEFERFSDRLATLSELPSRDLERLFVGTLDVCSHRLDAWVVAMSDKRAAEIAVFDERAYMESYLGGYGLVENVRPKISISTVAVSGLGQVAVQTESGGFVQAPSLSQANAAAILRCGRVAEKGTSAYDISLSSKRTRKARQLIEGLRAGQTLGAMLGYEFEEGLRALGLSQGETYILALRRLFPLVANKTETPGQDNPEHRAARNVVDGSALREAAKNNASGIPFGQGGLPAKGDADAKSILAEIAKLDDWIDALGDLTTAEAVLQISTGDLQTTRAILDALPEGTPPAEPEFAQSPVPTRGVNQTVALLFGASTASGAPGWPTSSTNRSSAAQHGTADAPLDVWAGRLLGDPSKAKARLVSSSDDPSAANVVVTVSVADLGLRPLDFVALARTEGATEHNVPLDRRLKKKGLAGSAPTKAVTVEYETNADGTPGIPEMLLVGKAIGDCLAGVREIRATDFIRDQESVSVATALSDVVLRADAAHSSAAAIAVALDKTTGDAILGPGESAPDARQTLERAASFVADTFPDPQATDTELGDMARSARRELRRRLDESTALANEAISANELNQLEKQGLRLRALFGGHSIVPTADVTVVNAGELGSSLARIVERNQPASTDSQSELDAKKLMASAPERFVRQAMRTREGLQRVRKLMLRAEAVGATPPSVAVAQVPFADEDWVGCSVPAESRLSLVFLCADQAAPVATAPLRGLLLDSWTELVPKAVAETGVALNYDNPCAEAPQVILLAVPPVVNDEGSWNKEWVLATINQAADLARVRPLTLSGTGLGQMLPGVIVANNPLNLTASVTFPRRGEPIYR
jgi:hypothetical protein